MKKNLQTISLILIISAIFSLGCQTQKPNAVETTNNSNKSVENTEAKNTNSKLTKPTVTADSKPDFVMTADEYFKLNNDLKKFEKGKEYDETISKIIKTYETLGESKIVEITGKVHLALKESTDGKYNIYIKTSYGESAFDSILCTVEKSNKADFEKLKINQTITVKGLVFAYPGIEQTILVKAN